MLPSYTPNINPALQKFADDVGDSKKLCINCPGLKVCQKIQQKANCDGRCQVTMVLLLSRLVESKQGPKKSGGTPGGLDSMGGLIGGGTPI